ncbi:MAG: alpha/beta hydrolase [Anaerolineaceae bacterium]|nr:alpha/beta hydrolase [Anaerolineaceae bacterium]
MKVFTSNKQRISILHTYDKFLQNWAVDYHEIDIPGAYGSTHCIVSGNKNNPPLILFHGVGDNSAVMWVLNIQELSKHFYCIAVDTIGGPGKSIPNEGYGREFDQVKWITSILDFFHLKKVNIVGVSNGGYMAYNYCLKESSRVNKIIGIEGSFALNPYKAMINTIGLLFPEILIPTKTNMMKILYKMSSPENQCFKEHPEIADYMIEIMKGHNQNAMFKHKVNKYIRNEAEQIKDKLLFLFGDYRAEAKKELFQVMESDGIQYKVFPKAGHGLNMEQAELINIQIVKYINCVYQ